MNDARQPSTSSIDVAVADVAGVAAAAAAAASTFVAGVVVVVVPSLIAQMPSSMIVVEFAAVAVAHFEFAPDFCPDSQSFFS